MQERANQPKQKIEYNFDVTKHIRLVPPFQEKEVDKYSTLLADFAIFAVRDVFSADPTQRF